MKVSSPVILIGQNQSARIGNFTLTGLAPAREMRCMKGFFAASFAEILAFAVNRRHIHRKQCDEYELHP